MPGSERIKFRMAGALLARGTSSIKNAGIPLAF